MSDKEPNLSAAQDQEVRRLLADARHDEPIPEDVAVRLDRVLAQLAAGDPGHDPGRVIELTSWRRAASLLVAAAAIVAIGVGLSQVVGTGTSNSGADSAQSDTQSMVDPEDSPQELGSQSERPEADSQSPAEGALTYMLDAASKPIRIRAEHFATDVERVRRAGLDRRAAAESGSQSAPSGDQPDGVTGGSGNAATAPEPAPATWFECTPADFGKGRLIPVLYDDEPAVLALRKPVGDTQVVELLQCGSGEILRSITLPHP